MNKQNQMNIINLRSRNIPLSDDSTPQLTERKPSKIPKAATKSNPNQKQQKEQQRCIQQLSMEVNDIKAVIANMESKFLNFQLAVQTSFESIKHKIDDKCRGFAEITQSIRNDIAAIKGKTQSNHAIEKQIFFPTLAEKFTGILCAAGMKDMEHTYNAHIVDLHHKITQIESTNKRSEEMVNDMATMFATVMSTGNDVESQHHHTLADKITATENAVECIQHEVDRLLLVTHKDDEKIIKINKQLHVLSSKYVDFNIKINKFLSDFNRININKLFPDDIIDNDVKPFMVTKYPENPNEKSNHCNERPIEQNVAPHRFNEPYNVYEYTRRIVIEIRELNIGNLQQYNNDFKQLLNTYIGNNMVKNATVTGYHLNSGNITSIRFVVEFEVPLNYKYIDSMKFPTNWYFFLLTNGQGKHRSMNNKLKRQQRSKKR